MYHPFVSIHMVRPTPLDAIKGLRTNGISVCSLSSSLQVESSGIFSHRIKYTY